MKRKENKLDIKDAFHNFNITNKKTDILSKVDQMNITEQNDIKIIKSFFLPLNFEGNTNILMKTDDKLNISLNQKISKFLNNKSLNKRNNNKVKTILSFEDIQNKAFCSLYHKNILNKKKNLSLNQTKKPNIRERPYKLLNNLKNYNLSRENKEKRNSEINFKSTKDIKFQKFNNTNNNRSLKHFEKDLNSNINLVGKRNTITNNFRNKTTNNLNNSSPYNKYYITANNFDSFQQSQYKKKLFNKNIFQTKSFDFKNKNINLPNSTSYNDTKNSTNSFEGTRRNLYKTKMLPKFDLNYWKLLEIEKNINDAYNDNFLDINEKNKIIKKIKDKCIFNLKEIDRKNNFEIQEIEREIKSQLLGLNFKDFYRYLLTILKNYDKKIADWSFDIIEEDKNCPEELKLKNVRHRHKKFMDMVNRQYVCGVNTNNYMDNLIKNSKNKLGFNSSNYKDKIHFINNNRNSIHNDFFDNVFTVNNYKSKFFETFSKNKIK